MKNFLTFLTGLVLSIAMVFGGFATTNVFAASSEAECIRGAQFLAALDGQDENGNEILVALYCRQDGICVAYVNDGHNHVYQAFTVEESTYDGIGDVIKYTMDDLVLNYFELSGAPCLITNGGRIYVCEYITEYQVQHIQQYDYQQND